MDTYIYGLFTIAYVLLAIYGLQLLNKYGWKSLSNVLLLVTLGLVWDNGLLTAGNWIGQGEWLETLSRSRFWLHAFLTPLLVLFAWHAACRAGTGWAKHKLALLLSILLTAGLILYELLTVTMGLELAPERSYGVLSYSDQSTTGPPLMVIVVDIALLIASIVVYRQTKWKWMFIGVVLMTIGSMVPIPIPSSAATNAFELILIVSFWATKGFLDKNHYQCKSS